jgi:hypothetical protein
MTNTNQHTDFLHKTGSNSFLSHDAGQLIRT